jgi:hypothetical protein
MKKLIALLFFVSTFAFGQSYPSPTYNVLTLQTPLAVLSGGTGNTTAAAELARIGAAPTASPTFTGTAAFTNVTVSGTSALGTAPTMGAATLYPTVATNTALKALSTVTTGVVTRLGFVSRGDIAALIYTASGSACSLNAGAGDNGSQVVSADSKCWIASFPPGEIDSREWGVIADGATDNTTPLQAAWTYAASVNRDVLLPPSNSVNSVKFSSITAPTPTNGNTGNRSALVGQGEGLTFLQSSVTGASCAIILNATYGVNSSYNDTFHDFTLSGVNAGNGFCITNVTHASFSHVFMTSFNNGVFAQDSIDISWIECTWNGFVNAGVDAVFVTNSHPNAWTFIDPHVFFAINYGMIFQNPADLNIIGGDWENNNISGTAGASALYILGNPLEGTKGLTMTGGYFSINAGAADITIADGGAALNGVHVITGAEFQRANNTGFVTNNILLSNNGTGITNLGVRSSGFQGFNSYVPSASRLYVTEANPASTDYVIDSGGNWFQSATETPTGPWWKETGWTAYTPSLSCITGSLTTASATGLYKRLTAKTIAVQLSVTVTSIGTCTVALLATLPTVANSAEEGNLRNTSTSISGSVSSASGSNSATMLSATGTVPITSGQVVNASIVYESQ